MEACQRELQVCERSVEQRGLIPTKSSQWFKYRFEAETSEVKVKCNQGQIMALQHIKIWLLLQQEDENGFKQEK